MGTKFPVMGPTGLRALMELIKESFAHNHDDRYYTKDQIRDYMSGGILPDPDEGDDKTELYAFRINQGESVPSTMITYMQDNIFYEPAKMNYSTGVFDYGDWENAFFIRKLKPVMLRYDGTIAYELDPNDYTKRLDGTMSDVANPDFPGNAMIRFPKVYWKIVNNNDNTAVVYISNKKIDGDYHCWSHLDVNGNEIDYCYIHAYNGSLVDGKLRSLSGKAPLANTTRNQEVTYAVANNATSDKLWYTDVFCDRVMIQLLLILMAKSCDGKTAYGTGNNNSYVSTSNTGVKNSGTLDQKGLFWGAKDNTSCVKVFGIENFWGNIWNSCAGWIMVNGSQRVKMTPSRVDGSTADGYNFDASGYITIPSSTPSGTSGGYINKVIFSPYGFIPTVASGSSTTYYCDGLWFNNSGTMYALVGGTSSDPSRVGPGCASLDDAVSVSGWGVGGSLTFKPLAV